MTNVCADASNCNWYRHLHHIGTVPARAAQPRLGYVAGERAALQRFRKHVQQLSGNQISASAAARLVSMADTLLRSLRG